jgi:LPS-assembly lipoprotein
MSLRISLVALFLIAGCGFEPMYGQKSDRYAIHDGVIVNTPKGLMGEQLKVDLEDRLNPYGVVPKHPAYKLDTTLAVGQGAIGVARDGTVSRYNIYIDSTYTLTRLADSRVMMHGNLREVSSYNNPTSQYFSTYVSQTDATKRGITELAEMYRARIGEYLSKPPSELKPENGEKAVPLLLPDSMASFPGQTSGAGGYPVPAQQNNNFGLQPR